MRYFFLFIICSINYFGFSQENLLLKHKSLLLNLSKYVSLHQVGDSLILFQNNKNSKTNFGYGVASKYTGEIIYPASADNSSHINSHGNYISIAKSTTNLGNRKYGLIDYKGNLVLDFVYDKIGGVFVPMPDSLITVQKGDKFAVFNTNTKKLSSFKYDNSGGWLNDGYSYHEGGSYIADSIIYSQLGIKKELLPPIKIYREKERKAFVTNGAKHDYGKFQYIINSKEEKISKEYFFVQLLHRIKDESFFIGATTINPHTYQLINEKGEEIFAVDNYLTDYTKDFIHLGPENNQDRYYFIENKKTVTIPTGYFLYAHCYSNIGILGFKKKDKTLFIDKNGNSITGQDLKSLVSDKGK